MRHVKAATLGQDPQRGPHQAHGFRFSVQRPGPAPRSLENTYKELSAQTKQKRWFCSSWSRRFTRRASEVLSSSPLPSPPSISGQFSNRLGAPHRRGCVLAQSNRERPCLRLWGSYVQEKGSATDRASLPAVGAHRAPWVQTVL